MSTAALKFWVRALHGSKVEAFVVIEACVHRRCCTATKTDQHGGSAEHHKVGAFNDVGFVSHHGAGITETAREHDGFMVAADFVALGAWHFLFKGAEIAGEAWAAVFVVVCGCAEWYVRSEERRVGKESSMGWYVMD